MKKKLIRFVRLLCMRLDDWSESLVVPKDLYTEISLAKGDNDKLNELKKRVDALREEYPYELSFIKASAVIERMKVIGR